MPASGLCWRGLAQDGNRRQCRCPARLAYIRRTTWFSVHFAGMQQLARPQGAVLRNTPRMTLLIILLSMSRTPRQDMQKWWPP